MMPYLVNFMKRMISPAPALALAVCLGACAHVTPEPDPEVPQTPDLTPDKFGKLFDCVVALQRKSPGSLYWVSPLQEAEGYLVTTQFHSSFTRKYSGHEIEIFSRDRAAYYWMPGAQHDATGFVPNGHYRVDADLPDHSRALRLTFEKRSPTAFVLLRQGPEPEGTTGTVQRVLPRPLDVSIIKEDLHEMAFLGVNFYAQALRSEALRGQVVSELADLSFAASCRGITTRLDTALASLEDALATTGAHPE
jgi:hypothetical protein